jgi:hypothetical protein
MNKFAVIRWCFILILAISGAAVSIVVSLFVTPKIVATDVFSRISFGLYFGTLAVLLGTILALLRITPPSTRQWRYFPKYPPIWISVAIGTVLVWTIIHPRAYPFSLGESILWSSALVGSSLTLSWIVNKLASPSSHAPISKSEPDPPKARDSVKTLNNWEDLNKWSCIEEPIEVSSKDLFSMKGIARRIAEIFAQSPGNHKQATVGLLGNFGSGKTSTVNMVEERIRMDRLRSNVLFARASCWGFDDSRGALKHVLSGVIETLSSVVDCTSVRALPTEYLEALSGRKGWGSILLGLLQKESDPSIQLKRLEPILKATGLRLCLVVEDVDRGPSSTFDPSHVSAMLNRIREVANVSFILTTSVESRNRIDFTKLCDHIEIIPKVDKDSVWRLLRLLHESCVNRFGDIDPMPARTREETAGRLYGFGMSGFKIETPYRLLSHSIATLVDTPRKLKHVVRSTLRCWRKIHGQVDIDELVVMNILRACAPEAFDFLLHKIALLRLHKGDFIGNNQAGVKNERLEAAAEDWRMVAEKATGWDTASALHLMSFLLPGVSESIANKKFHEASRAPQGVGKSGPVDYFRRIVSEGLDDEDLSDQEVLQMRLDWTRGQSQPNILARKIYEDQKFCRLWKHFDQSNPTPRLLDLADQLFRIILDTEGANAAMTQENGASILHWRAYQTLGREKANTEWMKQNILKAMQCSLGFVNDLYYFWASASYGIVPINDRDEARMFIVQHFKSILKTCTIQEFANIIGDSDPKIIKEMILPSWGDDVPKSILSEPSDWIGTGDYLIRVAELRPETIIPQIVLLIAKEARQVGFNFTEPQTAYQYKIDHELVKTMFAGSEERLMRLLGKPITVAKDMFPEFVDLAREEARKWLSDNSNATGQTWT